MSVKDEPEVTLEALQRAGILSSEPKAKPAGSSPALAIACPVCSMPSGYLCRKAGGAVQGIAHKRRRDLYWSQVGVAGEPDK